VRDTARARQKLGQLHALAKKQYVDPVTFARFTAHWRSGRSAGLVREGVRGPNAEHGLRGHPSAILPELSGNARFEAILDRMGFPLRLALEPSW
jgi:hypothetical protein